MQPRLFLLKKLRWTELWWGRRTRLQRSRGTAIHHPTIPFRIRASKDASARCGGKTSIKRLADGRRRGNGFWAKCFRMNSIAEMRGWMEGFECRVGSQRKNPNRDRVAGVRPCKRRKGGATRAEYVPFDQAQGRLFRKPRKVRQRQL